MKGLKTLFLGIKMAGAVGFEPTDAGSKDPCLTAWLHPSVAVNY